MKYILVGKLNKTFGTKGHIKVVPEKAFAEDLINNDVWFLSKGGDVIPYFIDSYKEEVHLLVKFEDIDNPESAKKITGSQIFLREKDVSIKKSEEQDDLQKLVGFSIQNKEDVLGVITTIEEYPQQLMAMVSIKNDSEEVLIPLSPSFILDMDLDNRIIFMDLPDGLIESQL